MKFTQDISEVINAIRDICEVGICYYDLKNFFDYDQFGIRNNRGHYCEFCKAVRDLENGKPFCEKSDRTEAVLLAKQYREPFFFECHMGIRELILPLMRQEELVGILFIGQCRWDDGTQQKKVLQGILRLGGDPEKILPLYEKLPLVSQKLLLNVGKVLSHYFDMILLRQEGLTPFAERSRGQQALAYRMRNFVDSNYTRNISAKHVAESCFVNPSYASRCFQKEFQKTITDYIQEVRIKRARVLLSSTTVPIRNIALNVGFSEGNYFSRAFHKSVGMTPQEYRWEQEEKRKEENPAETEVFPDEKERR